MCESDKDKLDLERGSQSFDSKSKGSNMLSSNAGQEDDDIEEEDEDEDDGIEIDSGLNEEAEFVPKTEKADLKIHFSLDDYYKDGRMKYYLKKQNITGIFVETT